MRIEVRGGFGRASNLKTKGLEIYTTTISTLLPQTSDIKLT
jgi:hypothetical protein